MEAMSSGCAVITSNVSGCPETVDSAGMCIDPENSELLNHTLTALIADKDLQLNLMKAARERAVDKYAWPSIANRYLTLLQSNLKS